MAVADALVAPAPAAARDVAPCAAERGESRNAPLHVSRLVWCLAHLVPVSARAGNTNGNTANLAAATVGSRQGGGLEQDRKSVVICRCPLQVCVTPNRAALEISGSYSASAGYWPGHGTEGVRTGFALSHIQCTVALANVTAFWSPVSAPSQSSPPCIAQHMPVHRSAQALVQGFSPRPDGKAEVGTRV